MGTITKALLINGGLVPLLCLVLLLPRALCQTCTKFEEGGDGDKMTFTLTNSPLEKGEFLPPGCEGSAVYVGSDGQRYCYNRDKDGILTCKQDSTQDSTQGWKKLANTRIRQLRQSDLTVKVNLNGRRPEGISLELKQVRHSFPFGVAVNMREIKKCEPVLGAKDGKPFLIPGKDSAYCRFVANNFNLIVVDTRWNTVERVEGWDTFRNVYKTLDWASKKGIRARGHCIFQSGPPTGRPGEKTKRDGWMDELTDRELTRAMKKRTEELLDNFHGKIENWDVFNEPLQGSYYVEKTGIPDIRAKIFKIAEDFDNKAGRFVNERDVISGGRDDEYAALIRDLLDRGAPVSGIGVQGHYINQTIDIAKTQRAIKNLGQFDLPIWVTEFDWGALGPDHSDHAVQLENFYRLLFSLPQVEGLVMGAFWDKDHHLKFKERPEIVEGENMEPNKAGEAFLRLMQEEWRSSWTGKPLTTDVNGLGYAMGRVFRGDYVVRVMGDDGGEDALATKEFSVGDDTTAVTVEL